MEPLVFSMHSSLNFSYFRKKHYIQLDAMGEKKSIEIVFSPLIPSQVLSNIPPK